MKVLGLRWSNVDLKNKRFAVVEQLPFKVPPGTTTITEMAPTKSQDRILPITDVTLPFFIRQQQLQQKQKRTLRNCRGQPYYDNNLVISKADGSPARADRITNNFGQFLRHQNMPHIRFHDLRHSAATNMHELTGDFYTVGEILGHTLKGIGLSLGISTNMADVTARYVDVRLDRKKTVLEAYHNAMFGGGGGELKRKSVGRGGRKIRTHTRRKIARTLPRHLPWLHIEVKQDTTYFLVFHFNDIWGKTIIFFDNTFDVIKKSVL